MKAWFVPPVVVPLAILIGIAIVAVSKLIA